VQIEVDHLGKTEVILESVDALHDGPFSDGGLNKMDEGFGNLHRESGDSNCDNLIDANNESKRM